jgi:hypothetical protein
MDVLIDSLIRALSTHGVPLPLYVDRAKIYLSNGLTIIRQVDMPLLNLPLSCEASL